MKITACFRFGIAGQLAWCLALVPLSAEVRMWEEELVIPTWLIGPEEVDPTFSWSSPRDDVYPYPYKEILTDEKADKKYKACRLENEFIKVLMLPEIGGRLHGAQDKTNGYNFFYWHPSIKPALVSMTGAWISGGIEWNFPHGHRPTCFSPVQYRLVENSDGSKTVWVGEPELVYRLRWIVGITIYPGKSVIEAKVRLMNPSPLRQSFQMWATTATNANEDYQLIFPTRLMTGHGKVEYYHWPINEGVDLSWWKNVPNAASYFAVEPSGFFGGYDHAKKAGTVIAGNPHIVIGKKFWTWGTSPSGRIWERILSDGEGPYAEPQAGAYSDNQPDYHWIQPGEIKSYSHYFFPVRDIGPFKMANIYGAANLEFEGDEVRLGVYSTGVLKSAQVLLEREGRSVFDRTVDLDPATPFTASLKSTAADSDPESFVLSLKTADGEELLSYRPKIQKPLQVPEPAKPLPDATVVRTQDELWHYGEYAYKFRSPDKGRAYFEEALRRDPGDSRSHLSLAEMEIKLGHYEKALQHLDIAAERDPDNGMLFYLRGLAQEALKDYEAAYEAFYRAVHFGSYFSRSYEGLARLSLRQGDADQAVSHLEKALQMNALNPVLWTLKSAALRQVGKFDQAGEAAARAASLDPLDALAVYELARVRQHDSKDATQGESRVVGQLLHDSQTAIEFSLRYANAGLYEDADRLLTEGPQDALTRYYRGYFSDCQGDRQKAAAMFEEAAASDVDGVFPFRLEELDVFDTALKYQPDDGKAYYFKGLVYAKVADVGRAVTQWENAVDRDPGNPRAWRDLGLALMHQGDVAKALQCYSRSFALDPQDSRVLLEMDQVKKLLGISSAERLKFLKAHPSTVEKRDALVATLVDLLLENGECAEALEHLKTTHFHIWEGKYEIHNIFMEANICMAEKATDPADALRYYQQACEYPLNLEIAPREPNLRGFLYYPMAQLYRRLGDDTEATRLLQITAREATAYPTLATYYQALALRDLGEEAEAGSLLDELKTEAEKMIRRDSENYRRIGGERQEALGHYYLSKVLEMQGDLERATAELAVAVSLLPGVSREAVMLAQRVFARASQ